MILIGELYNFWCASLMYLFQRMMHEKRYRFWIRYLQMPMNRTPQELKLVGYSSEDLAKFWKVSNQLQSIALKFGTFNSIFVMSLSAISYVIIMHQRYGGKLHSAPVFWSILLVGVCWETFCASHWDFYPEMHSRNLSKIALGQLRFVDDRWQFKLDDSSRRQSLSLPEYPYTHWTLCDCHEETDQVGS